MTDDKFRATEHGIEKQSVKPGDKPPAGSAITSKQANRIQQLQERREALATARLTQDPEKGLKIDMGDGRVVEDKRPVKGKGAEQASRDIDYKPQKTGDHSYGLGVNRQDIADIRTAAEKLQDFVQAAAKRATDPEGWKAWAQGEINKFSGIGSGLNEAKGETKAAVVAGWKAMTDGTVIEFLSQPNAINAPVFKTVENAFEAMSKDPEAVNKALEALGKVVLKASEGYSNLPDAEKGKVIGKVMFGMINPEGDIKDAEAALKIGDTISTHVDKSVMQTIDQAMKAAEQAAKTSPELAQQTKQMLYDYLRKRGLSASELEKIGEIPKGYFDSSGRGGDWPVLNERPSPDVVLQTDKLSCVSAVGEMLTNGSLKQAELIEKLTAPCDLRDLAGALGPPWKGHAVTEASIDALLRRSPFAAGLRELPGENYQRIDLAHAVVVDGLDAAGNVMIRDPADGVRYEMTREQFLLHWNLQAVFK